MRPRSPAMLVVGSREVWLLFEASAKRAVSQGDERDLEPTQLRLKSLGEKWGLTPREQEVFAYVAGWVAPSPGFLKRCALPRALRKPTFVIFIKKRAFRVNKHLLTRCFRMNHPKGHRRFLLDRNGLSSDNNAFRSICVVAGFPTMSFVIRAEGLARSIQVRGSRQMGISRRNFLKGSVAAGASIAAMAGLAGCASPQQSQSSESKSDSGNGIANIRGK